MVICVVHGPPYSPLICVSIQSAGVLGNVGPLVAEPKKKEWKNEQNQWAPSCLNVSRTKVTSSVENVVFSFFRGEMRGRKNPNILHTLHNNTRDHKTKQASQYWWLLFVFLHNIQPFNLFFQYKEEKMRLYNNYYFKPGKYRHLFHNQYIYFQLR